MSLEDMNDLYGQAMNILKRVKAIGECDVHGYDYINNEEKLQDAYKLGNYLITRGELDFDRKALSKAIEDMFNQTPECCYGCAKVEEDDDD
jgi:hypothetical protein